MPDKCYVFGTNFAPFSKWRNQHVLSLHAVLSILLLFDNYSRRLLADYKYAQHRFRARYLRALCRRPHQPIITPHCPMLADITATFSSDTFITPEYSYHPRHYSRRLLAGKVTLFRLFALPWHYHYLRCFMSPVKLNWLFSSEHEQHWHFTRDYNYAARWFRSAIAHRELQSNTDNVLRPRPLYSSKCRQYEI